MKTLTTIIGSRKKITRQKTINKKIITGISELENEISLIDFSVTYDIALTSAFDDGQKYFFNKILTEEIKHLSNLSNLLLDKASNIKDKDGNSEFNPVASYLLEIANKYKGFIPHNLDDNIEEAKIITQEKG